MKSRRILSIDILRGLVMVIMVLDHVRDFVGKGFVYTDPTDLDTSTPLLFWTRWITHFCAPVFVFLSGTSAFLFGQNGKSKKELSLFLLSRGLFLILLELTIVNFAWSFDINLRFHAFQVIWAIGMSMVVLSALVFFPIRWIAAIGICIVFGHNLLDNFDRSGNQIQNLPWYLFHQNGSFTTADGSLWFVPYPFLPWLGVMLCGFGFGYWFREKADPSKRRQFLYIMGFSAILLFIVLRLAGWYGDPMPWQADHARAGLSFFNCHKYPPSLHFILMTLGPALVLLAALDRRTPKFSAIFQVFGKVPLFFYVLHLYLVHLVALLFIIAAGRPWTQMIITPENLNSAQLVTYGYSLTVVYGVWIALILLLYLPCKWYGGYKARHKNSLWLSYL